MPWVMLEITGRTDENGEERISRFAFGKFSPFGSFSRGEGMRFRDIVQASNVFVMRGPSGENRDWGAQTGPLLDSLGLVSGARAPGDKRVAARFVRIGDAVENGVTLPVWGVQFARKLRRGDVAVDGARSGDIARGGWLRLQHERSYLAGVYCQQLYAAQSNGHGLRERDDWAVAFAIRASAADVLPAHWNEFVVSPLVRHLRMVSGGGSATAIPCFHGFDDDSDPKLWLARYRVTDRESEVTSYQRADRPRHRTVVPDSAVGQERERAGFLYSAPILEPAEPVQVRAEFPGLTTSEGGALQWRCFIGPSDTSWNELRDAPPIMDDPPAPPIGLGTGRRVTDNDRGGVAFTINEPELEGRDDSGHLETTQLLRVGAVDLRFPEWDQAGSVVRPRDRSGSAVATFTALGQGRSGELEYAPQIALLLRMTVIEHAPGALDPDLRSHAPDDRLVLAIQTRKTGSTQIELKERVRVDRPHTFRIDWKALDRDTGEDPARLVVVDRSPFMVAGLSARHAVDVDRAARSTLGVWRQQGGSSSWVLPADEGITLTLPPQAVGEPFIKHEYRLGYPDPERGQRADSRFGVPTTIQLLPAARDRRYAPPPWDLRRLFGSAGDALPGLPIESARFELLYGLTCELTPERVHLVELEAMIGAPTLPEQILPLLADEQERLSNRQNRLDPSDLVKNVPGLDESRGRVLGEFIRDRWDELLRLYRARLGVLEPRSAATRKPLRFSDGLRYTIRARRESLLGDSEREPWEARVRGPFKSDDQDPEGLPGGVTWGFESKNVLSSVMKAPTTTRGTLTGLKLSALGGWGHQRADFRSGLTRIYSDTSMGRVFYYSVETLGRIACLWNIAKHVIVYERTVAPTDQFIERQSWPVGADRSQRLIGLPVVRKVREYIEILEPKRYYPEDGGAPRQRGFFRASSFVSTIIPVDPRWGRDFNRGWKIPLWQRGADGSVYPRPQVQALLLGDAELGSEELWSEVIDPSKLWFYALTHDIPESDAEPGDVVSMINAWPPVRGLDFPDLRDPVRDEGGYDHLAAPGSDDWLPDAPRTSHGLERFTLEIKPPARPVNITSERSDRSISAVIRNVTISRGRPTGGITDIKQDGTTPPSAAEAKKNAETLYGAELAFASHQGGAMGRTSAMRAVVACVSASATSAEFVSACRTLGLAPGVVRQAREGTRRLKLEELTTLAWLLGETEDAPAKQALREKLHKPFQAMLEQRTLAPEGVEGFDLFMTEAEAGLTSLAKAAGTLGQSVKDLGMAPGVLSGVAGLKRSRARWAERAGAMLQGDERRRISDFLPAALSREDAARAIDEHAAWLQATGAAVLKNLPTGFEAAREVVERIRSLAGDIERSFDALKTAARDVSELDPGLEEQISRIAGAVRAERDSITEPVFRRVDELERRILTSADRGSALDDFLDELGRDLDAVSGRVRTVIEIAVREGSASVLGPLGVMRGVADDLSRLARTDALALVEGTQIQGLIDALWASSNVASSSTARINGITGGALNAYRRSVLREIGHQRDAIVQAGSQAELRDVLRDLVENVRSSVVTGLSGVASEAMAGFHDTLWTEARAVLPSASGLLGELDTALFERAEELFKRLGSRLLPAGVAEFGDDIADAVRRVSGSLPDSVDVRELERQVERAIDGRLETWKAAADDALGGIESDLKQVYGDTIAELGEQERRISEEIERAGRQIMAARGAIEAEAQAAMRTIRALEDRVEGMARGAVEDLVEQAKGQALEGLGISEDQARGIFQAGQRSLRLVRAFGDTPIAPGLEFNRKQVAYYFDPEIAGISTTRMAALLDRTGRDLKALGLRMPTEELLDRILPKDLHKQLFADLFPDFAGLKLNKLLEGLTLPEELQDNVELTHEFDRANRRASVEAKVNVQLSPRSLFSIGPLAVSIEGTPTFAAVSNLTVGPRGVSERRVRGAIVGDWVITVGGLAMVTFERTTLAFNERGKLKFNVSPERVRLPGLLQQIEGILSSETLVADEESGFTLNWIKEGGLPTGVEARLDLPIPATQAGVTGIANLTLGASFALRFYPEFIIGVGVNLARKDRPFTITIFVLGGAGYVQISAFYRPSDGKLGAIVSVGIYLSASIAFALGPIKGGVWVYFGITADYRALPGAGQSLAISYVYIMRGEVSCAGLISVTICVMLEVSYLVDDNQRALLARGSLSIRVKICWCFTFKFSASIEYRYSGGKGTTKRSSKLEYQNDAAAYMKSLD